MVKQRQNRDSSNASASVLREKISRDTNFAPVKLHLWLSNNKSDLYLTFLVTLEWKK